MVFTVSHLTETCLVRRSGNALEQAAPGGGGVTITGGVQESVDVALRDMVSGHGGDGSMIGHDDHSSLFQP